MTAERMAETQVGAEEIEMNNGYVLSDEILKHKINGSAFSVLGSIGFVLKTVALPEANRERRLVKGFSFRFQRLRFETVALPEANRERRLVKGFSFR